jgi:hypothetical protein
VRRPGRIAVVISAAGIAVATAHAVRADILGSARPPKRFSIAGHVDGLQPGAQASLPVRIRNPWSWSIRVKSVSAQIDASGRPCPVRNVWVRSFRGSFKVPPKSSRTLVLLAGLRATAPKVCQGATFALTFRGRAVRR